MLSFFTGNAQITEGNWLVGGEASFNTTSIKDSNDNVFKSSNLSLRPNLGYFLEDKFAVGLEALLGYTKNSSNNNTIFSYGGGPFVRYYFLETDKIINILSELNYNYFTGSDSSTSSNLYSIKAGPVIYFNSSVGLEILLKYEHVSQSGPMPLSSNSFQIGIGLQVHLER